MRAEAGLDPLLVIVMRLQGFDQPILNQASGLYKRQEIEVPITCLQGIRSKP
jgi:hypothetical protein